MSNARRNLIIFLIGIIITIVCLSILGCTTAGLQYLNDSLTWTNSYMSGGNSPTLTIIVRGMNSNSLISGVAVRITGKYNSIDKYGTTDSNGGVSFSNVPVGTYTVKFGRSGGITWTSIIDYGGGSKSYVLRL